MPAMFAHQYFGDVVYEELSEGIRRRIDAHRDLYNIGLQGPDIFFYQDPIFWGRIPKYGNRLHEQSGCVFFGGVLERYYEKPEEPAAVYLMGVVCHYSLDAMCHRRINEADAAGGPTHAEQEGEFDRHLIERTGRDPVKEDISRGIRPSREASAAIAAVYPEVTEKEVLQSLKGCIRFQRLVRCPTDFKRNLFYAVLKLIGKYESLAPHIIRKEADPNCAEVIPELDRLFDESVPKAVRMITRLDECLREGKGPADCRCFLESEDCGRSFDGVDIGS